MHFQDFLKDCRESQPSVVLSSKPMPPVLLLHTFKYPAHVEFDYHSNSFSSACLIESGSMELQERGYAPFVCGPGNSGNNSGRKRISLANRTAH